MSLFNWNSTYSVGVAAMDSQHKRLVDLVNRIYEAMQTSKGDLIIGQILQELVSYTKTHFAAEESLMQKVGYPKLAAHQAIHKTLADKVIEMQNAIKAGKMVATVSLAMFLKDWLAKHIQDEDVQYGVYIQNRNLVPA